MTGAASGIGAATVARLAAEGAAVVGIDLADAAPPALSDGRYRRGNVLDSAMVDEAVRAVVHTAGRLDGVVHSAGVGGGGPVHLLADDASFVSGQAIAVDGGYTAGRDHQVTELLGLGEQ